MDQLDSYTLSMRVAFKGTLDGKALDTADIYTRTFSLNPPAHFTIIQTYDDKGSQTTIVRGWVGDVLYSRAGLDAPCTAQVVSSTDHPALNPAILLRPMVQGKEMGRETVNGVQARHFVMDTLQNANTQISGDVFIADPIAYVAKYSMAVKGGEEYFGKGLKGEETTTFEVRDPGAKKPVAIPAGCPPAVIDLPATPDATNVSRSLSQLDYTTASGIAKTTTFYQEQLKTLGWTLESSSVAPERSQPAPGVGPIPIFQSS